MLGGPTKVNVIEPSHANVKSHAKNSQMGKDKGRSHCYCKTPTGGDELNVGGAYTLGTASPRVCTGPGHLTSAFFSLELLKHQLEDPLTQGRFLPSVLIA